MNMTLMPTHLRELDLESDPLTMRMMVILKSINFMGATQRFATHGFLSHATVLTTILVMLAISPALATAGQYL